MANRPPDPQDGLEVEEDEEWEEEDEAVDFDLAAPAEDSENDVAELLLELTINVVRLRMLMDEAEEGEYKAAFKRLQTFYDELERLPNSPTFKRPMGFRTT